MKKKFTLLIMSAALLLGGTGQVWGQAVWGGGYSNPGTDLGAYGPRHTGNPNYWYGGDYNARGANYFPTPPDYSGDTDMILLDGSTSRSASSTCSHTTARSWASSWGGSYGVYVHIPINGSTWSIPNYYNRFAYGTITITGTDSWTGVWMGCSSGGPISETHTGQGVIQVAAGTDVRLAGNIQHPGVIGASSTYNATTSTIRSSSLRMPAAGAEYSIRFDAAYTGTNNNYHANGDGANKTVTITPGTWTQFTLGQGIGFLAGITSGQTFSVTGGVSNARTIMSQTGTTPGEYTGTRLMLGNQTVGQNNITVNTGTSATGAVYIFNYTTAHDLVYGFGGNQPTVTVNVGDLLIRNDNIDPPLYASCYNLTFTPAFAPTISGDGSIFINDYNNDAVITPGTNPQTINRPYNRGITAFSAGATFNFGSANTGNLVIEGANVTFGGAYTYSATAASSGNHYITARGSTCSAGNIAFTGGAVTVTKTSTTRPTIWIARNNITTSTTSPVDYELGGSTQTDWRAGNNIDLHSKVDVISKTGHSGDINWYAMNNIMTNWSFNGTDEGYINYDMQGNSSADVLWNAITNIHTKGRVNFGFAAGTTGTLTLKADTGDITAERVWAIDVNNDANDILISAESTPGINNRTLGEIFFYDSLRITRGNVGAGKTEILSQNDIWTSMVDIENTVVSNNTYLIESHSGDIWFGHNDVHHPNPSAGSSNPSASSISYDRNNFTFIAPDGANNGWLHVYSGFGDQNVNKIPWGGGNIRFTHINEILGLNSNHPTEFKIPFSNWYYCGDAQGNDSIGAYEQAGIIGGVGRCAINIPQPLNPGSNLCDLLGLNYQGYDGELLFDAGTRGNIIINNGVRLSFQEGNGNAKFLTRWGDIDMRYPFDVDSMKGGLLFLANSELPNKLNTGNCTCEEKRNNVYLQDFQYNPLPNSGSVFIGADNNIKIQYGGLKGSAWNTNQRDPFYSGNAGYPCGTNYHCDSDTTENQARDLILDFGTTTSGGFAAVASDLIDVYKQIIYTGGTGSGLSPVPTYGSLHGESVAGYGLYIKTQANKKNWDHNAFGPEVDACWPPKCDDPCTNSILQNVARVTFHSDARIYTENQRTYIGSPVLDTYGNLELNTHSNKGGKTSISIQTDSLIVHDSLIIDGKLTRFTTWSGLYRDMPIVKLGHQRFTPPFEEDPGVCAPCFIHEKTTGTRAAKTAVDSIIVSFRNGASMDRLHTLVADHTVLTFQTDSFDGVKGDPVLNAKFYADTFKVRNHVELYADAKHWHDGHFELISEEQMASKDYAGIYSRHLHMEPIGPTCSNYPYSQLWLQDPALDVITTSTFGGYGWLHADVHVEIEAKLAPGFASMGNKGNYCYELKAGTLKMQDLRMDKGAELHVTIGEDQGLYGELADCIDVDELTMYGTVNVSVTKRCGQKFEEGCYPIIRYNSVAIDTVNLNNLNLVTRKIDGYLLTLSTEEPGIVYLCVGDVTPNPIRRQILIPSVPGVTTDPEAGAHYMMSQSNFDFKAMFTTEQPLKVMTNRVFDGKQEELAGKLNANGEYEYTIRQVTQNIVLTIGPDFATSNGLVDGTAVWSHDNTIYIKVEKEDIASIYSVAGQLVKRIDLPQGSTPVSMERGVYIVTLKDGSIHKVILK